jgi:hypothetical protein
VPSFFFEDEMAGPRTFAVRFWTALNEFPKFTLFFLLVLYLAIACAQAATRLLWGDELITLAVARAGGVGAIWHALNLGTDPNPPLSHFAVLLSIRLLSTHALAIRLPSIAAMLLAIVCVWVLLRRWVIPGFAAAGVLALMTTRGVDYSYEARSYAALAGFTVAALVCWLWAGDCLRVKDGKDRIGEALRRPAQNWTRAAALAGMATCLALAVSSNYYGVLAWFPIAAGEIAFSMKVRRVYPATWLGLTVAALPLYSFLPLIRRNIAEFTPHAWNRPQISMVNESYLVLVEGVFWPVLLGALWLWWRRSPVVGSESRPTKMRAHERVALVVLLAYPFLGFAVAVAEAGMISPRCVIPVCCGFGIAAGLLAAHLVPGARTATMLVMFGVVWVVARESACAVLLHQQRTSLLTLIQQVERAPAGSVYVSDSSLALPLAHYGDSGLRERLVFPIDFPAIHALETEDSGEQNLWAGRDGVFPFRIVPYSAALAQTRPALVIARPNGWLTQDLRRDGLSLLEVTSADQKRLLGDLGGVFTPMVHERTRLLAPVP